MEIKNYDWKNIVFEIRDLIAEKFGYREKYYLSNIVETNNNGFHLAKIKCNMDVDYAVLDTINGNDVKVSAKYKKYNDELFSTSILMIDFNKPIEYDVSNIIIDRWVECLEKTYEDVKYLEKIQELYRENGISLRFIISLIHEIGHAFEDVYISEKFNRMILTKRLNFNEANVLYHKRRDETLADIVSINTLYLYNEEILNIILKNKKKNASVYDKNSMFSFISECNKSLFDEAKSKINIDK